MANGHDQIFDLPLQEPSADEPCQTIGGFEAFFHTHQQQLLSFLRRRTGSHEDAQDLVQESYLRMVRFGYTDPPRPEPVWRSLLYRTANSLVSNLGREQRSHHAAEHDAFDELELVSELPSPERQVEARQEFARMLEALHELPPRCRQVFLLHRLHGKSYSEIAVHCDISVKAVEKHISKALAAFRSRVGESPWDVSE